MRIFIFKTLICVWAIIAFGCSQTSSLPENVVVGEKLPEFTLTMLDGSEMQSSSLEGQIVVLNFWATWCQNCIGEIPELKELSSESQAKVIGIALDEDGVQVVKPFIEKRQINYTILIGDQEIFQRFNGVGIPYTLVVDRSQRIVKIYRGAVSKETLLADLKKIDADVASSAVQ